MTLQWAFRNNLYDLEKLCEKSYEKLWEKLCEKYMHCYKCGLVTIWRMGLVFGVWFCEVLGIRSFCTVGASCEVVAPVS